MKAYEGIYDSGVVRLLGGVTLPEGTKVIVTPQAVEKPVLGCNSPELYAILSERYDTGETDLAARVDELDP
jgi:predicted DNA-binding antitoxin AbrB/MazE fold protein